MYAIIDIETGGFSVKKNAICEVAIGVYSDNGSLVSSFHSFIEPYLRPDPENPNELASYKDDAMAVNRITMEQINSGINLETVLAILDSLACKVQTIYAHNSSFDFGYIDHYVKHNYMGLVNLTQKSKWKCTKELAKGNFQSTKLQDIAKELGISTEGNHRAMKDVEILNEVIIKMKWNK